MADPFNPAQPSPTPEAGSTNPTAISLPRSALPEHFGPYRILRELAAGGMGVVYIAEDTRLRRQVALKVIRPEVANDLRRRQRFMREAVAAANLKSDHIVTVHAISETDGIMYMVLELLEGESLKTRLERKGRLPVPEAARIAREATLGLAAAHCHELVHRDVTPANIFLVQDAKDRVKLLDFGLVHDPGDETPLTREGAIFGTPGYLSPEQAAGDPVTVASDLFSLGCVLYEMLTGRKAFQGRTHRETINATLHEEPPPAQAIVSGIPARLDKLLFLMLAKDPADRPASAQAVADELAAFAATGAAPMPKLAAAETRDTRTDLPKGTTPTLPEASKLLPAPPAKPQHNWALYVVAAAISCVLMLFVFLPRRDSKPTSPADDRTPSKNDSAKDNHGASRHSTFAPLEEQWVEKVRRMDLPAKQYAAVSEELLRRNPGLRLTQIRRFDEGALDEAKRNIRSFSFLDAGVNEVEDISPLKALPALNNLTCKGTGPRAGKLVDLSPLRDLPIVMLDVSNTRVSDLSPLAGKEIAHLDIVGTNVRDLSPLATLRKLEGLNCGLSDPDGHPLDFQPLANIPVLGEPVIGLLKGRGVLIKK